MRHTSTLLSLTVVGALGLNGLLPQSEGGPFQYDLIANTRTQVPNQPLGETYSDFGIPALHRGRAVFRSNHPLNTNANNTQGNFDRIDTGLPGTILSEVMQAMPFVAFNGDLAGVTYDPSIYNGNVGWGGATQGGGGVFRTAGSQVIYVAGNGPGFPTSSLGGFEAASIFNNNVTFPASSAGVDGIQLAGAGPAGLLVDESNLVPGTTGTNFATFLPHTDYNFSRMAFAGAWFPNNDFLNNPLETGIYRWNRLGGVVTRIADKNVSIPAQAGNFDQAFGFFTTSTSSPTGGAGPAGVEVRPSLSGSEVAFAYDDGARAGVYRHVNGSLKRLADRLTKHPTLPGNFRGFRGVSTIGGSTAFVGTDANGTQGLYLAMCNQIMEVVREGPSGLFGGTIVDVELGHRGLAVGNPFSLRTTTELAFRLEFADGTSGIYWATTNHTCANTGTMIGNSGVSNSVGSGGFSAKVLADDSDLTAEITTSVVGDGVAVFGADLEQERYGVDANPGNDPTLIDFTLDGTSVIPERLDISFNQDVELFALHLEDVDPNDSVILLLPNSTLTIDVGNVIDGVIDLGGVTLAQGSQLGIQWDPNNSLGDGVSFNGVELVAVPEPTSCLLMAFSLCSLGGALLVSRRRLARQTARWPVKYRG